MKTNTETKKVTKFAIAKAVANYIFKGTTAINLLNNANDKLSLLQAATYAINKYNLRIFRSIKDIKGCRFLIFCDNDIKLYDSTMDLTDYDLEYFKNAFYNGMIEAFLSLHKDIENIRSKLQDSNIDKKDVIIEMNNFNERWEGVLEYPIDFNNLAPIYKFESFKAFMYLVETGARDPINKNSLIDHLKKKPDNIIEAKNRLIYLFITLRSALDILKSDVTNINIFKSLINTCDDINELVIIDIDIDKNYNNSIYDLIGYANKLIKEVNKILTDASLDYYNSVRSTTNEK